MQVYTLYWPYSPFFTPSIYLPLPTGTQPLAGPVLHSCTSFLKVYISCSKENHCGVLPMNILYFNQISQLHYSSFSIPLTARYLAAFDGFVLCCIVLHFMQCISILFTLCHSLFLFLLPLVPSYSPLLQACSAYICIVYVFMYTFVF
jgi:hypothetical protein